MLTSLLALAGCFKETTASVARAAKPAPSPLEDKLDRLILPKMPDMAGVSLEEAVEYLRVKTREADKDDSFMKGVNFVIVSGSERGPRETPTPGAQLTNVPVREALRQITEQCGMKYRVDTHAVAIGTAEHFQLKRPQLTEADSPSDREKCLLRSLRHYLRPTINFQNATVEEAVEFLRTSQGCLEIGEAKPAVEWAPKNMVLKLHPGSTHPHITLDLKDIPMADALFYIAELSSMKVSLRSSAIVLSDHDLGPPPHAPAKQNPLELRASQIILPAVTLQEDSLADSLDFFRRKVREFDPQGPLQIVVRPGGGSIIHDLTLKEISLLEALDHIALQSGHFLSCDGNQFILTPLNTP